MGNLHDAFASLYPAREAEARRFDERRSNPPPPAPACRADQIIAEGARRRVAYRHMNMTADTAMVFGAQTGYLHAEVKRLCNELESFNATRDPALHYEAVYCGAMDCDVDAGFNYDPGDPGDPGEEETLELTECWVNGANIIGGISETASEQIAAASLDKYHARQAKARELDGPP